MKEIQVRVKGSFFWRLEMTPMNAARYLAERSWQVALHTEPVKIADDIEQNKIRQMYFQFGGKTESRKVADSLEYQLVKSLEELEATPEGERWYNNC